MQYRSMQFHKAHPNLDLVRLGADLGFNNLDFNTEQCLMKDVLSLRERADRLGYFKLARELGMSTSMWVHELEDVEESWLDDGWTIASLKDRYGQEDPDGVCPVSLGNERLWDGLRKRYDLILGKLVPELDYVILTVVESQIKITDPRILTQLVKTVHNRCRTHGKRLILRTFTWNKKDAWKLKSILPDIPQDIMIMTKCVPQDWHLRSINHPLIGDVGGRDQIVEVDIAGEYFRMDHVANVFPHLLGDQFGHWQRNGVIGITVRVDRGYHPEVWQNTVYGQAQEANLWVIGYLATGKTDAPETAVQEYARKTFGETAGPAMAAALMTTGDVMAEGLCVDRETFGDTRSPVPAGESMRARTWSSPKRKWVADEPLTAATYREQEDSRGRSPFDRNWSVWRWDPSFKPAFKGLQRGDPEVILRKDAAYAAALKKVRRSLELIDSVQHALQPAAYSFFRFKVEETGFHLLVMCELELAWLKSTRCLYSDDGDEKTRLQQQVQAHLARVASLFERTCETLTLDWKGRTHKLKHGAWIDIPEFLKEFRRYWMLPTETKSDG